MQCIWHDSRPVPRWEYKYWNLTWDALTLSFPHSFPAHKQRHDLFLSHFYSIPFQFVLLHFSSITTSDPAQRCLFSPSPNCFLLLFPMQPESKNVPWERLFLAGKHDLWGALPYAFHIRDTLTDAQYNSVIPLHGYFLLGDYKIQSISRMNTKIVIYF